MSTRTLSEIIDAARDGDRPTPDECYHDADRRGGS